MCYTVENSDDRWGLSVGRSDVVENAASANLVSPHTLFSISDMCRDAALIIAYNNRIFTYHIPVRTGDLQIVNLAGIVSGRDALDADCAG